MNDSYELNCTAAANVYSHLEWLRNGVKFMQEAKRVIFKDIESADFQRIKTLTFSRLVMSDDANYTCVGYKRIGGTSKISSQLIVKGSYFDNVIFCDTIYLGY